MAILVVVDNPARWSLNMPGVELVSAKAYLTDASYSQLRGAKVFNLCRSYSYQSMGYYVSLLAEARGHKPLPAVTTIQDMKSGGLARAITDDLDEQIQKSLHKVRGKEFTLSIYFGRCLARRDDRLAAHLFSLFPAPLLRAQFVKRKGEWQLRQITPISAQEIPDTHHGALIDAATEYFASRRKVHRSVKSFKYDMAVLVDPDEEHPPSNERAIARFVKVAESIGIDAELITREDYERVAEYDALFIRTTTQVNHYTYRFARRAAAEGLVVIDDPQSIARCCNKVYMAELLAANGIHSPKTVIVHEDNIDTVVPQLGLPCILKQPEGAFSTGVKKVTDEAGLQRVLKKMLEDSELIVAQEFAPTEFDWRIGIVDRQPIYACRYYMADEHWQIIHHQTNGQKDYGRVESMPVELAPRRVVQTALRVSNLIGDGLYGVDLKQFRGDASVIEVNDNPSIDHGFEDSTLGDELYWRIMQVFLKRLDRRREGSGR